MFQDNPDAIFLAIVDEALVHTREVHLVRYREGYRPTRAERRELEESYRDLFPELVPLFTRRELVRVIDRLRWASRDAGRRYALTDYHWLVLYACLQLYGDLHNDGATCDRSARTRSSASTSTRSWTDSSSTPTSCWGRPCSRPRKRRPATSA